MAGPAIQRILPITGWLRTYKRSDLSADLVAGLIVAIMLVPQGMAYALLAGLPPEMGLYASVVPLVLYSLFASSRVLAVGPVAIVSLMVASTVGDVVAAGVAGHAAAAVALALLSGAILITLGLLRVGFLVNFLSHPVISGFTSAAALVIAFSQIKHLLGVDIPRSHLITDIAAGVVAQRDDINLVSALLGVGAIVLLLLWRAPLARLLTGIGVPPALATPVSRAGPLAVVILTTLVVWGFALDGATGVRIVGEIPAGLPPLALPAWDLALWRELLPGAALIAIVGFLESVSVAKALASKRRQKVEPNQELIALGAANLGAAATGAYPVAGGFGRSMVNFTSGAVTPIAGIVTALLIALVLLALTPLFHYLPRAALAAVILVAVAGLVDFRMLAETWRYNRADAVSLIATFVAVLAVGVELGIVAGAVISLGLFLWRTSRPHIAVVGRVGETEHYRNVLRHDVTTWPHLLAVRVDESLYFANTGYLEERLIAMVAEDLAISDVVLICSAVNEIDASALESLERVAAELRDAGVTLHLAEVKGPVMDRLARTRLLDDIKPGRVWLSTHQAMQGLGCK